MFVIGDVLLHILYYVSWPDDVVRIFVYGISAAHREHTGVYANSEIPDLPF